MRILPARIRNGVNTFLYGRAVVRCETCGTAVRPSRAVWRGARPYCSVAHEHADFAI